MEMIDLKDLNLPSIANDKNLKEMIDKYREIIVRAQEHMTPSITMTTEDAIKFGLIKETTE